MRRPRALPLASTFAATLLLILLAFAAAPQQASATIADDAPFVTHDRWRFKLDGKPFVFAGYNAYQMPEAAGDWGPVGKLMVKDIMNKAQASGLTVMRIFGFAGRLEQNMLQTSPGVYNDKIIEAIDYVLAEAAKHDIRVVLVLESYWNTALDKEETGRANGIDKYIKWAEEAAAADGRNLTLTRDDFYTNPDTKRMYKDHVRAMLTRKNSVNGRVYRDDPTIFSYNIMNEPRCEGCGATLQSWIDEMAAFVRSVDPNHMITVGEDGFYSKEFSDPAHLRMNPGAWADDQGQDFIANHAGKDIDYAGIHIWPDDWNHREVRYQHDWCVRSARSHARTDARTHARARASSLLSLPRASFPFRTTITRNATQRNIAALRCC